MPLDDESREYRRMEGSGLAECFEAESQQEIVAFMALLTWLMITRDELSLVSVAATAPWRLRLETEETSVRTIEAPEQSLLPGWLVQATDQGDACCIPLELWEGRD